MNTSIYIFKFLDTFKLKINIQHFRLKIGCFRLAHINSFVIRISQVNKDAYDDEQNIIIRPEKYCSKYTIIFSLYFYFPQGMRAAQIGLLIISNPLYF